MKSLMKLLSLVALLLIISNVNCASDENKSSFVIYSQDPKEHKKGETYEEITRFNQVYFTQEANFGSCNSKCEDYAKPRNNLIEQFGYDQRPCKGTIHGCKFDTYVALFVYKPKNDQSKRYNYVVEPAPFSYTDKYGKKSLKESSSPRKVFNAWARGFVHCDICRCLCDESNDVASVRKFLLRDLTSDVDKNKVVTGLQLVLKDKIFSLKIYQAPLLPFGKVDEKNTTQKTASPDIILQDDKYFKLEHNQSSVFIGAAQINWEHYVVTGVKFTVKDGHLALEATFTKFEFSTGKLIPDSSLSLTNDKSKKYINQGKNGEIPTKFTDNQPSKDKEGLVQFEHSNLKDDVGQSTVPFLDLQPVKSFSGVALSGVGLLLRTNDKSGGFIAPKLITYPMDE